jgi:hypothetical protein
VVVPALDEAACLPRLVARLLGGPAGEDRADEVLVVDGGSRDGTAALAREAGAQVMLTEPGRGRQLAAGAREVRAELVAFLHADSLPRPGALAALRRTFVDPEVVACGMVQEIEATRGVYRAIERASSFRVRRLGWIYGDAGLTVRRRAYREAGGYASLPVFEDLDLCRRLGALGRVVLAEDARLAISARRWEAEGVVRATARNWLLTLAYLLGVEPHRLARHYSGNPRGAPAEPVGEQRDLETESAGGSA